MDLHTLVDLITKKKQSISILEKEIESHKSLGHVVVDYHLPFSFMDVEALKSIKLNAPADELIRVLNTHIEKEYAALEILKKDLVDGI